VIIMRDYLLLYINGKKHIIKANEAKKNLSSYLRENLNMKGTKIVCSEGDCGACTVLVKRFNDENFISVNSCILPLYLLDCCQIITIEGIENDNLHQVQTLLSTYHGTQCGFCTPGFVNSMVYMCDDLILKKQLITEQKIKNYTTGNLCRCTGYKGIIQAGMNLDLSKIKTIKQRYETQEIKEAFNEALENEVVLSNGETELILPKDITKAIELKKSGFNVISGGTDISVFVNKGYNKNKKFVSLNNISELYIINDDEKFLEIGSKVTLTSFEKACKKDFPTFTQALRIFASPQIKNIGTVIGNVANGSPIGDTMPLLYVSDAILELSGGNSRREVLIYDYYLGYKKFDLKDDEIITKIKVPKTSNEFKFYKVSARKDLDISAVSLAISYKIEDEIIKDISIAFGGVAATTYKAKQIEEFLINKEFSLENIKESKKIVSQIFTPFSDHRGSSTYRIKLCENLLLKFYNEVSSKVEVA